MPSRSRVERDTDFLPPSLFCLPSSRHDRLVYIGLGMKDSTISLPLFKVHDALTKKAGLGCIVRAVCAK